MDLCWICEVRVGQFLWKQGLQDEYSVLLRFTSAAVVVLDARRSLSVRFDILSLFLFSDVVFP
jgi:hypothetical protein